MTLHLFGLLAMFVGVLLWCFATKPKLAEGGRLAFACGLLVVLTTLSYVVRL